MAEVVDFIFNLHDSLFWSSIAIGIFFGIIFGIVRLSLGKEKAEKLAQWFEEGQYSDNPVIGILQGIAVVILAIIMLQIVARVMAYFLIQTMIQVWDSLILFQLE